MQGNNVRTNSKGKQTETASNLYTLENGTVLTSSNFTKYTSQITKISEADKKAAIDKFMNDFVRGNLAYSQVSTILNAIGVESKSQKLQNDNYIITFTFENKNYSVTCNKAAAKSGIDDIIVKTPEEIVMDEFYDGELYESYTDFINAGYSCSVEDGYNFINKLNEYLNKNADDISFEFKVKLNEYKDKFKQSMLNSVGISMTDNDYEKELADKILSKGLAADGSGIDLLRTASAIFEYDSNIKDFMDKAIAVNESGDIGAFKNIVNIAHNDFGYIADELNMMANAELSEDNEDILASYLESKYPDSNINIYDIVSYVDIYSQNFVNSRWNDTNAQKTSLFLRCADAFYQLTETAQECGMRDIEEMMSYVISSLDLANEYSYLSDKDFTEEFFNNVELCKETAVYGKKLNKYNSIAEFTKSRFADYAALKIENPNLTIREMEKAVQRKNSSITDYVQENYPESSFAYLANNQKLLDVIRHQADSYVRYEGARADNDGIDKSDMFNKALDICIYLATFAQDSEIDPVLYVEQNFFSTITGFGQMRTSKYRPSDFLDSNLSEAAKNMLDNYESNDFDFSDEQTRDTIRQAFAGYKISFTKLGVYIQNGDEKFGFSNNEVSVDNKKVHYMNCYNNEKISYDRGFCKDLFYDLWNGNREPFYDAVNKYGGDDDYDKFCDIKYSLLYNCLKTMDFQDYEDSATFLSRAKEAMANAIDISRVDTEEFLNYIIKQNFVTNYDLETYNTYLLSRKYLYGDEDLDITKSISESERIDLIVKAFDNTHTSKVTDDMSISSVHQGHRGDCYFLNTIIALSNTPVGMEYLKSLVDIDYKNKKVTVKIMGLEIELSFAQIDGTRDYSKESITRALEMAYSRARAIKGQDFEIGNGGNLYIVLHDLFGKGLWVSRDSSTVRALEQLINNKMLLTEVAFKNDTEKVYNHHSYSIVKTDENFVYLKNPHGAGIANPWDDNDVFTLTWDEFNSNFQEIQFANVNDMITPAMLGHIDVGTYEQIVGTAPEYDESIQRYVPLDDVPNPNYAYVTDGKYIYNKNTHECVGFKSASWSLSDNGEYDMTPKYIINGEEVYANQLSDEYAYVVAENKDPIVNTEAYQKLINRGYEATFAKAIAEANCDDHTLNSIEKLAEKAGRKDDQRFIATLARLEKSELKEVENAIANGSLKFVKNSGGGGFTVKNIAGLRAAIMCGCLSGIIDAEAKIISLLAQILPTEDQIRNDVVAQQSYKEIMDLYASMDAQESFNSHLIEEGHDPNPSLW